MIRLLQESGLSALLGEQLMLLHSLPLWLTLLVLCVLCATLTEFFSGGALILMIIPLLDDLVYNIIFCVYKVFTFFDFTMNYFD